MPQGWKLTRIGDICKSNQQTYSLSEKWSFINYLDTGNITENHISEIQYLVIGKDILPSRARRKIAIDDILYSTVRPNQRHYGIVKKSLPNMLVSTGFTVITVNKSLTDSDFLYYYLTQNDIVENLHTIGEQSVSAYPSIKPSDIEDLELLLPPLSEQVEIGRILRVLDDKIANNTAVNHHLEQMAQAVFKSWFVDFEPCGGVQPADWSLGKAEDFFDISIGKTPPRIEPQWFTVNPQDVIWVSISDMGGCGMYISDSSEYLTAESVARFNVKIVPSGTVLLSFKLTVGRVAIANREMTTNEAIAHFKFTEKTLTEYLYFYLKTFDYQVLGNTSSIATAVNSKTIKAMPFLMPSEKMLKEYHVAIAPFFEIIRVNLEESSRLATLRDILLPRLMSGELSVSVIDKQCNL
jgi:type I restriction enzyme S subunit